MASDHRSVALITGATGFIGSNLSRRLARDGWRIHAVVRPDSIPKFRSGREVGITPHIYDGSTGSLRAIMDVVRPEIVFHLASYFVGEHFSDDITRLVESNLLLGTQLLEAMSRADVSSFVNTGTSWQHFEDQYYNPVNLYAATKQAFEDILRYYVEAQQFRAVTLALFDTYGPGDSRPKLLNNLMEAALGNELLRMSPGAQQIDLVYIDDVVEAYLKAADRLISGLVVGHERYAITSGSPIPLYEVVKVFEEIANAGLPIEWGSREYRAREVMVPWRAGVALPGWVPKVSLQDGLKRLVDAHKSSTGSQMSASAG